MQHNIDKEREREGERGGGQVCVRACVSALKDSLWGYLSGTHPSSLFRETPLSAPWTEAALTADYFS